MAQTVPSWVPAQYQSTVAMASAQYNVPASILAAVLKIESGFNPNAQSSAGAEGIAQFEPGTAAGLGVNPWDPQSAIPGAAKLLSQEYAKYNSWTLALAAYNGGEGAISNGTPSPATAQYASTVLGAAQSADPTLSAASTGTGAANDQALASLYQDFTKQGGDDAQLNALISDLAANKVDYTHPTQYGWTGDAASFKTFTGKLKAAIGPGQLVAVGSVSGGIGALIAGAKGLAEKIPGVTDIEKLVGFFGTLAGWLTDPKKWARVGLFLMGGLIVIGGVFALTSGLGGKGGGSKTIVPIPV
jgi:hypothetical protein